MESNNNGKNKSGVNWPTFIVAVCSLALSGVGCWVGINRENATQEVRIINLEVQQNRIEAKMDKISDKLDDLNVMMVNKQDRSN